MNLDARQFAGRARDPRWERDLARDLRSLPEADRLAFLEGLFDVHQVVALELARRCLEDKKSFESVLEVGLQKADVSSIRDWLKCVLPKLGASHVVQYLSRRLREYPKAVESARYWLPELLTPAEKSTVDLKLLQAA